MNKTREQSARVTIVIPAYNEERHLRACLQAIAAQTKRPHQVIVVDNNSSDATTAVARSFPFVTLLAEPQQGRVFARNTGFNAATGDVIGRIDADIVLPPHWVAHISGFYGGPDNANTAWTGAGYFHNVRLPRLVSWAYALFAFRLNLLLTGHYSLWGSNMALTRQQWLAVRDEVHLRNDIHEDLDLALHLGEAAYDIYYDRTIRTSAELRRVQSDRDKLWDYLQWWPRTLKVHHRPTWIICWLASIIMLYPGVYVLVIIDKLAQLIRYNHRDKR